MRDRRRKPYGPGHYANLDHRIERSKQPGRDRYDWITLWTAMVGVALVCVGTGVTAYQAVVMRQELDNAISQQRPWLRIEAEPKTGFVISPEGAAMGIAVKATNVGAVPALGVHGTATLYAMPTPDSTSGINPYGRVRPCEAKHKSMARVAIFPGETTSLDVLMPETERRHIDQILDNNNETAFIVMVCVHYETGNGSQHHRSGAAYILANSSKEGSEQMWFHAGGERIKANSLRLERLGAGEIAE